MKTILFLGDSVTDAGRNKDNDFDLGHGYPKMVADYFQIAHPDKFRFINTGVSGDTSACIYARKYTDIIKFSPDIMTLLVGFNDVSHGLSGDNGVSPKRYSQILDMLIEDIKESLPEIKIIMLEPYALKGKITDKNWESLEHGVKEIAAIAKDTANKHNLEFITLQNKINVATKQAPNDCLLLDGIHPAEKGHRLIADEIIKAIENIETSN